MKNVLRTPRASWKFSKTWDIGCPEKKLSFARPRFDSKTLEPPLEGTISHRTGDSLSSEGSWTLCLDPPQPFKGSTPGGSDINMADRSEHKGPPQDKIDQRLVWTIWGFLGLLFLPAPMEGGPGHQLVLSSHTPQNWTWSLKNALTGAHIATITTDRQPHFIIHLCSLGLPIISGGGGAGSKGKVSSGKMGKGGHGGKCGIDDKLKKTLQDIDIYACPIGKNKRYNGGPGNHCHH
ncbi:uncharacterized protein LOC101704146 [Heterocephalus glaber]|uniref:Uncharacterized protein LOC101704146 n=1 Tax=Heterocephalus glaber TaxID=10181 RepID=A0AAX6NWJ9_HETGA|nr:uncharacterized protein LOC101704146 [Heterocephalus glaber]